MARTVLREPTATNGQQRPLPQATNGAAIVPLTPAVRRRPTWMIGGVVLVGFAALLGAWVFTSTSSKTRVLVAARDISPGEVVTATDLRVVEMSTSGDVRAITTSLQGRIIGHAARGPIPNGTVLNVDLFTEKDRTIPAGSVVVGAALDAGAAPTSRLAAGDRVDLLAVSKNTTGAAAAAGTVLARGTVWSVERIGTGSTSPKLWMSVLVDEAAQTEVAQAAADGRLRLALVSGAS